jgi:hypothetical protein
MPVAPASAQTFAAAYNWSEFWWSKENLEKNEELTAPIPPLAPVMMIILPFCEFDGLEGRIAGYGSRCFVFVIMKGVVN